jgi:hypothetical protein
LRALNADREDRRSNKEKKEMAMFRVFPRTIIAVVIVTLALASAAHAQATRTYVSAQKGSDGNLCTLDKPCRTFGRALTLVLAGGVVVALDSGDYEPMVIDKSVTVEAAPGVHAGITVNADSGPLTAAWVNSTTECVVVLRGLTFNGIGNSAQTKGVLASYGVSSLHIENCVLNGLNVGISFASAGGRLSVKDTIIRNAAVVPGETSFAVSVGRTQTPDSPLLALIDRCRFERFDWGVGAGGKARVVVRDSIAAGNYVGFGTTTVKEKLLTEMVIENCLVTGNDMGIRSYATAGTGIVRVSNSTITNNSTGVQAIGSGMILSRANNTLEGNESNGVFSGLFTPQ